MAPLHRLDQLEEMQGITVYLAGNSSSFTAAISSLTVLLPASDRLLNYPNKQKAPGEFISPGAFAIAPNCIKREARQKLNDPLQKEGLMRKDNPPIPVGIETGGLESLQRFETHWKVQK